MIITPGDMETTRIIEGYLDRKLSAEERAAVEERASTDSEFRNLIELYSQVNESIADNDLASLRQLIESIGAEYAASESKARNTGRFRYYFLRIAALLILIAGPALLVKYAFFTTATGDRLFRSYYETYDADVVSRSSEAGDPVVVAIERYSRKDYSRALSAFDIILKDNPENHVARFYKGLTCMEMNLTTEAINSFRSIPDSWESSYREQKNWYMALAMLKQDNIREAAAIFNLIIAEGGFYAAKARKINARLIN